MDRRKRLGKWIPKLYKGKPETAHSVAPNCVSDGQPALKASPTNIESNDSPAETSHEAPSVTVPKTPSGLNQKPQPQLLGPDRYREKAQAQYLAALDELNTALKSANGVWKTFKTPSLADNISQADIILRLEASVNETSDAQITASTNPEGWKKFKHTMKTVFVFTSPFAKILLAITKQYSLVCSHVDHSDVVIDTESLRPVD
jgi:hypothetical protein